MFQGNMVFVWIAGGVFAILFLVTAFLFMRLFQVWLKAFFSGVNISPFELILMRIRGINPNVIVDALVASAQGGVEPLSDLSSRLQIHHLAGGDVEHVAIAMAQAKSADVDLDWETALKSDLAGRNLLEEIRNEAASYSEEEEY